MQQDNDRLNEWCLIESNPCIFYDMLQRMGAKVLSVEDVYDLDYFEDYINNKDEVTIDHILSVEEYKSETDKLFSCNSNIKKDEKQQQLLQKQEEDTHEEKQNKTSNNVQQENVEEKHKTNTEESMKNKVYMLYKDSIYIETKYNKLLKNERYVYGIIFLFNIGKDYDKNKYVKHNIPDDFFFAKQVIPNACATQAILSIILNKNIELHEQIQNIKTFSIGFDSYMKGLTLSNCCFLRNIHNSYKRQVYVDEVNIYDDAEKNKDLFHFVSYIEYNNNVYLLDGLQEGPVLIKNYEPEQKSNKNLSNNWITIAKTHIKKEMEKLSRQEGQNENRFNVLAIIKDKSIIIKEYMNIHKIVRERVYAKLLTLNEGETINEEIDKEINEELNEYNYDIEGIPSYDDLPDDINLLNNIIEKATNEIDYLKRLLNEQTEIKNMWKKECTFKCFNFYPFIVSTLNLMAKNKLLKKSYKNEKAKKTRLT
ncbi:deubiquinating/deneddylating enzyme [Hepatocystis sp. ex Piliocolobus tephrosceles]|nr:deubiquinating/deneddylating enzyme [Hepatocystis sp. ex Piliocolobus tephrosceles]